MQKEVNESQAPGAREASRPSGRPHPATAAMLCGILIGTFTSSALSVPPALLKALPADGVVTYLGSGSRTPTATRSTLELTTFLADQANKLGLLSEMDECSRMWIDSAASLSTLTVKPHAVILFDVRAQQREDGGHELAGLKLAIVMLTKGANTDVERRIQHFLTTYTNSGQGSLSEAERDDGTVHTFRDQRLPDWAILTWGQVGDFYVLGVGDDSFERVAKTIRQPDATLDGDEWFGKAFYQTHAKRSAAALYLRFDRLLAQADNSLAVKIRGTLAPLGLGGADRGLWTIRQDQRSVEATGVVLRNGATESMQLAGQQFLAALKPPTVPVAASGYAAVNLNPGTVLRGVTEAYLASQSPKDRERLTAFWRQLADDTDVSIERDIFSHLSKPTVIHNYPPHIFRLPLAWTFQFPIKDGADEVRRNLDRLLTTGKKRLDETGAIRLHQIASGTWFMQFGLAGPAVAVTDRWLILGYSPQAVQQNVELLSNAEKGR